MKKRSGIFSKVLIALIAVPVIEMFILVQLAQQINWFNTILIAVGTGVVGGFLAKQQGKEIIDKIKNELSLGRMPGETLLNGLSVLIGGVLLLTPGILTDITGFLLIIPLSRIFFMKLIKGKFDSIITGSTMNSNYIYVDVNEKDYNEK